MKKFKKVIIVIVMFFIALLFSNSSYAVTRERAGEALANFAKNFYQNYGDQTQYVSGENLEKRETTYTGITVDGKYQFDCVGWVSFAVHQCLHIGNENFTYFAVPPGGDNVGVGFGNGFELIKGSYDTDKSIDRTEVEALVESGELKPGDILFCSPDGPHVVIYVGNGKIIHCYDNLEYEDLYDNDMDYTGYCAIGRISESTAESIEEGNITEIFDGEYMDEYGRYYGTIEGRYVGSYNFLSWLFNQFLGFFDYLFGILAYIIRAPFLGWTNIVENLINDTIISVQGVQVKETDDNIMEVTNADEITQNQSTSSSSAPSANSGTFQSVDLAEASSRINIEDLIFNNVPILDVDFFDSNLSKYVDAGKLTEDKVKNSPAAILRKNIAAWYFGIRNASIVAMLLILVYLGIRLAISTVSGTKAKYKGMLEAWLMGFIAMFFIHYFMIIVLDANNLLIGIFKQALDGQLQGSASLYDTIRTRAYSFKLSEGVPATVIYMVLVYYLIRFLYIYVKRYFTVNILALMGPIVAAKYSYDKISKGKTSALTDWMYDFTMNVLLQSVHGILYATFMLIAFDLSTTSIPGFVLALCMLNFIFKAEDLFLKIFKFTDRASSLRSVKENKNYVLEAYKVTTGVAYFSKGAVGLGFGLVANTTKFVGGLGLMAAQATASGIGYGKWLLDNRQARNAGTEVSEYKPFDVKEKLEGALNKVNAGVTGALDDALYTVTGARSLRLGLGRLKVTDKDRYETTKELIDRNKAYKRQVMKRHLGNGVKSVTSMAKLIGSIPMIVVDPESGFTLLGTTIGNLNEMGTSRRYYGHLSDKQRIGTHARRVAKVILGPTYMGYNVAEQTFNELGKEKKKWVKNEEALADLRQAQVIENDLEKHIALLNAEREMDLNGMLENDRKDANKQYDKALNETVRRALNSVLMGRNIQAAIKEYMLLNKVTKLKRSDIAKLIKQFNLGNIESQIKKLREMQDKEAAQFEHELDTIKEAIKDAADNVNFSQAELDKLKNSLKETENRFEIAKNRAEIIEKLRDRLTSSTKINENMIHQTELEKVVNQYINDKNNKNKKLKDSDVENMAKIFESRASDSEYSYASKETIIKKFETKDKKGNKKSKELDMKKSTNAILDGILEEGAKGIDRMKNEKQGTKENSKKTYEKVSNNMFEQLEIIADMVVELKTLEEKHKVTFGRKDGISSMRATKKLNFGQQNRKKK